MIRVKTPDGMLVINYFRKHGWDLPASQVAKACNKTRNSVIALRWRHRKDFEARDRAAANAAAEVFRGAGYSSAQAANLAASVVCEGP